MMIYSHVIHSCLQTIPRIHSNSHFQKTAILGISCLSIMSIHLVNNDLIPEGSVDTLIFRLKSIDFRLSARNAFSGPRLLSIS